ncbi:MAG: hypothetical protein WBL23_02820 [Salinisphaera sp.]|uniref:hypothetical protein n=1 Tax=Salinisphaera sp. TaxID=1914330 RepID=UPI003C79E225
MTSDRRHTFRGDGWAYVHIAIDDPGRVAPATIPPDEIGARAVRALIAALRYYPCLSVRLNAVLTDNEACYPFRRFAQVCCRLTLRHRRTRPYWPRTNGKAERWVQTALYEWGYAHVYQDADGRAAYLPY